MTIHDDEEPEEKASSEDSDTDFTEDVLGYQLKDESDTENSEEDFRETTETDRKDNLPETVLGFDLMDAPYDDSEARESVNGEKSDDIFFKLELIEQQLNNLSLEFQSKLGNDAHKDKIIDALHQELQAYKNNIINKEFVSMVKSLIKIIDDIKKISAHYRSQNSVSPDPQKLLELLESIPSDIEDVFSWHGVTPYTLEGNTFDPSMQNVLKKIGTQEKEKDRTIAGRHRCGYKLSDKTLRAEIVDVYVYSDAPVKPDITPEGSSNGR